LERSKSERLLLNVLPKAIAERLKAGQRTIVDSFIDSTVMFADIVGFTRIAARQSPHRTVQLLNELFSGFDRIAEQRELEKVKTIPIGRISTCEEVADAVSFLAAERSGSINGQTINVNGGMYFG
ncbi:MAG: SDR family oxidoreductase, partial [Deltaproteobacteria bacterium]